MIHFKIFLNLTDKRAISCMLSLGVKQFLFLFSNEEVHFDEIDHSNGVIENEKTFFG